MRRGNVHRLKFCPVALVSEINGRLFYPEESTNVTGYYCDLYPKIYDYIKVIFGTTSYSRYQKKYFKKKAKEKVNCYCQQKIAPFFKIRYFFIFFLKKKGILKSSGEKIASAE